jgi:outer membrane translocation and assembly module TamA
MRGASSTELRDPAGSERPSAATNGWQKGYFNDGNTKPGNEVREPAGASLNITAPSSQSSAAASVSTDASRAQAEVKVEPAERHQFNLQQSAPSASTALTNNSASSSAVTIQNDSGLAVEGKASDTRPQLSEPSGASVAITNKSGSTLDLDRPATIDNPSKGGVQELQSPGSRPEVKGQEASIEPAGAERPASSSDQTPVNNDRTLSQRIEKDLQADTALTTSNIKINAANGRVTLRGSVETEQQKRSLEEKVKAMSGVSSVDNQVEVKAKSDTTNTL